MGVCRMLMLSALLFLTANVDAQQLEFGFDQQDLAGPEGVLDVTIIKRGENVSPFIVNITPLTREQAQNMIINVTSILDAAESDDFDTSLRSVTFQPSLGDAEMVIPLVLTDDEIHENTEGFVLQATLDINANDPIDTQISVPGFIELFVSIVDNDDIDISFVEESIIVNEQDATFSDRAVVRKSRVSELDLTVIVTPNDNGAVRGVDYIFPNSMNLTFAPDDVELPVSFDIVDNDLLQPVREFQLQLSVPTNNGGQGVQPNPIATVTIREDELGVVGFEQSSYTFTEGQGSGEVCVILIQPEDPDLVDSFIFATITLNAVFLSTENPQVEATGGGVDVEDFSVVGQTFTIPRLCFDLTFIDDEIMESTEQFNLTGEVALTLDNITFEAPSTIPIFLEDNDAPVATTDVPSVTTDPPATTENSTEAAVTEGQTTMGMGGDPHFSILLPTGQLLCFSIQGEHGFTFNLISNKQMHINARFIPDEIRSEVTWLGSLGIVAKGAKYRTSNDTRLRIVAKEEKIYLGDNKATLDAKGISRLTLSGGILSIAENEKRGGLVEVEVVLEDVGLAFTVRFVKKNHLDMVWNQVLKQDKYSHGLLGQFFREGVEVDEPRRLLQLPGMEPVPVMRKPVWHFMERETPEEQLCWVAMNPGYQGKHLIQGHYLDYLVDDVLSTKFAFKKIK